MFGSFSRGQGQKRRQTGSQKASSTSRLSKKDGGSVEGETLSKNESVIQSGGKMKDLSLKGLERTAGTKSALKGTIAEKPKEKKSFGELLAPQVLWFCLVRYILACD